MHHKQGHIEQLLCGKHCTKCFSFWTLPFAVQWSIQHMYTDIQKTHGGMNKNTRGERKHCESFRESNYLWLERIFHPVIRCLDWLWWTCQIHGNGREFCEKHALSAAGSFNETKCESSVILRHHSLLVPVRCLSLRYFD